MFLSKVEIDKYNRKTVNDLTHLGCYHGWVEDCFDEDKSNRSRKLWRIDKLGDKESLLILSKIKPDLEILEKYGVKGTAATKSYDKLINSIKLDMQAYFKVELNAVKSTKISKNEKRGKIRPLRNDELIEFFNQKAKNNGFEVVGDVLISSVGHKNMKKGREKLSVDLKFAICEGVLRVTNEDKFKKALIEGIGRKKAYGFGLLSIAPITN